MINGLHRINSLNICKLYVIKIDYNNKVYVENTELFTLHD
jgi:hypothetical protein